AVDAVRRNSAISELGVRTEDVAATRTNRACASNLAFTRARLVLAIARPKVALAGLSALPGLPRLALLAGLSLLARLPLLATLLALLTLLTLLPLLTLLAGLLPGLALLGALLATIISTPQRIRLA